VWRKNKPGNSFSLFANELFDVSEAVKREGYGNEKRRRSAAIQVWGKQTGYAKFRD
jgi:hypothetical protein